MLDIENLKNTKNNKINNILKKKIQIIKNYKKNK